MEAGEDLERPMDLDPEALGFMCGLEIHQQLDTGKLHSRQPSILYDVTADTVPTSWPSYRRRLRAPSGEGGPLTSRPDSKHGGIAPSSTGGPRTLG